MPDTSLDHLCDVIRPQVEELLRRTPAELGMEPVVLNTMRNAVEQARNVANGVSFTSHSLHLPQPGCQKAHAVDVAPRHLMALKNWAPSHPDWLRFGELGESLNLKWGGRWAGTFHRPTDPTSHSVDCPHYQVKVVHPVP